MMDYYITNLSCNIVIWVDCVLVIYVADPGWSSADRRQVGVWEDFCGGALQWWLGPDRPAHLLGYADAGRLLSHHSRLRGAAREGMAELRSPFPAGKTAAALFSEMHCLFSLMAYSLLLFCVFSPSALVMVIKTTLTPTAHLCSSSLLIVCGS